MPILSVLFLAIWFGFLGLFLVASMGPHTGDSPLPAIVGFGGGMGFLFALGRWMARDEREYLIRMLARRTEGTVVERER